MKQRNKRPRAPIRVHNCVDTGEEDGRVNSARHEGDMSAVHIQRYLARRAAPEAEQI